jgi:hypothetical protein
MNPRVCIFVPLVFLLYSLLLLLTFRIILFIVSLANALAQVTLVEAKLKTTAKALKEADEKCAKEVSAAKVSAKKWLKRRKPWLPNPKKTLAEFPKGKPVVKRLL